MVLLYPCLHVSSKAVPTFATHRVVGVDGDDGDVGGVGGAGGVGVAGVDGDVGGVGVVNDGVFCWLSPAKKATG